MADQDVEPWARTMFARDAASRAFGMELLAARPGRSVVRMRVREDMVQGHGSAHGGVLFSLADTAFAFCCNGPDRVVVGSSADITWVAAAHVGDVLVAEAVEEAGYGRNGVTRVRMVREGDGTLVALFQGRSRQVR
jgi:acyl-CoA thioesterase